MPFRDLSIKKSYHSTFDDTIHDFYLPVLTESIEYKRLSGFFSSTSLAIAAIGIFHLIRNGGDMHLITSPHLSPEDIRIIKSIGAEFYPEIENRMIQDIQDVKDDFTKDHLFALAWMLVNNRLKIKIAIPAPDGENPGQGLFHMKCGILKDRAGETLLFSGSINETMSGWSGKNIEEFKVFKSWIPDQVEYMKDDMGRFEELWNNELCPFVEVIDIFDGVEKELVKIAPKEIDEVDLEKWYKGQRKAKELFAYQEKAIANWEENGCQGILEMATGTGKTYTALGCAKRVQSSGKPALIIIACPFNHLLQQWQKEIEKFNLPSDKTLIADGTNPTWKKELNSVCWDLDLGDKSKVIVLTTHTTLSSKQFIQIIETFTNRNFKILIIGDEVHGIGSTKRKEGLLPTYDYRLGLSATPHRHFDEPGTEGLLSYFGKVVYEFPLEKALSEINPKTGKSYLTPYLYFPRFITLTDEEMDDYISKTQKIAKLYPKRKKKDQPEDDYIEYLLRERANIIKNAQNKYVALQAILSEMGRQISNLLIYCSENDPEQKANIMRILSGYNVRIHTFTMDEDATPSKEYGGISQREYILKKFSEGEYQALVAQRCLDEGVDVPPARSAILMASSTNPRQYIQRIGRVIRRSEGKEVATIYDMIVAPSIGKVPPEIRNYEKKIFENEIRRAIYVAERSQNGPETIIELYRRLRDVEG